MGIRYNENTYNFDVTLLTKELDILNLWLYFC